MIRTGWLPSALGPGQEDDEAKARFSVETEYQMIQHMPGFEVRISGETKNVVRAITEWWETGNDEEDAEFVKWAISTIETHDPAREAAMAELAEANAALNKAVDAETEAGRARLRAQARLVEARERAAEFGIDG